MELTFRVIAFGIQPQRDSRIVRNQLPKLFVGDSEEIDALIRRIFSQQQVVLAKNLPQENAENLLQILTDTGLKCRMEPMQLSLAPIENEATLYQCPACGHKQPPNEQDICERCGVANYNYENYLRAKEAREQEQQYIRSRFIRRKQPNYLLIPIVNKIIIIASVGIIIGLAILYLESSWIPSTETTSLQSNTHTQAGIPVTTSTLATTESAVPKPIPVINNKTSTPAPTPTPTSPATPVTPTTPAASPAAETATDTLSLTNPYEKLIAPPVPVLSTGHLGTSINTPLHDLVTPYLDHSVIQSMNDNTTPATANSSLPAAYDHDNPFTIAKTITTQQQQPNSDGFSSGSDPSSSQTATAKNIPSNTNSNIGEIQLLIKVARYQAETGELTIALQTVKQIEELSNASTNTLSPSQLDILNRGRVEAMTVLANQHYKQKVFSTAQDLWLQALNVTNAIKSLNERALAFASLARSIHNSNPTVADNYFKRAEDITRTINDPLLRTTTLSALARDLAATGRLEQSSKLFAEARVAIAYLPTALVRLTALSLVAQHFAEAGNTGIASNLLQEIDNAKIASPLAITQYRLQTQGAIARNLNNTGDRLTAQTQLAALMDSTNALEPSATRDEILIYLAQMLAATGDVKAANAVVSKILVKNGFNPNATEAKL